MAAIGESGERIDAVYLWVDGADPGFQRRLRAQAPPEDEGAAAANRFRDNGELRYSLRSLVEFAPWVGRIHIVTAGPPPAWLDARHPRIRLVSHADIFACCDLLPTFNSCAIELNLHRIPGLSSRFLYLNDDLFLGREATAQDFLPAPGRQTFFLEPIVVGPGFAGGPVHDRAYLHTTRVLDRLWRKRGRNREAYLCRWRDRLLLRPRRRRLPAHVPQLYDRGALFRLEAMLAGEFRATCGHRFRSADDLVLRLAYCYSLLEGNGLGPEVVPVLLEWGSENYEFLMLEGDPQRMLSRFSAIARRRPKFICINDDLSGRDPDPAILDGLHDLLEGLFPRPAAHERP